MISSIFLLTNLGIGQVLIVRMAISVYCICKIDILGPRIYEDMNPLITVLLLLLLPLSSANLCAAVEPQYMGNGMSEIELLRH